MKYIRVKVFPDAGKEAIIETSSEVFSVYLRAKPKNNAANKRLVEIMAKHLDLPHHRIRIMTGHRSFNKTLGIKEP